MKLEYEPYIAVAKFRQVFVFKGGEVAAIIDHLSAVGPVKRACDLEQSELFTSESTVRLPYDLYMFFNWIIGTVCWNRLAGFVTKPLMSGY